jgi:predicted ATPase
MRADRAPRRSSLSSGCSPVRLPNWYPLHRAEVPFDLALRLFEQTEGLPLFLIVCIEAIADDSTALETIPAGMRDLLRARVERLSEMSRQLLAAASVVGHSFNFETLHVVSGRSEDEATSALDELVSRRMVQEPDAGVSGVRFDFGTNNSAR